jgi:hypothetical protein
MATTNGSLTMTGPPRHLNGCLDLGERQPGMVEKGTAGGGQFDAVHAAAHQLDANLVFEIADLAAEGGLRRVQPCLFSAASVRLPSSATAMK